MAIFPVSAVQKTNEIVTYTIDFTADIPTGGSVTAATAVHTPPSGSGTAIVCTVSSPYVYVTVPALTTVGIHYVDISGTMSDADTPAVRLVVEVVYPTATARASMADLIVQVRSLTATTPNDYAVAGNPYWTDAQIQTVLDRHVTYVRNELIQTYPVVEAGGSTAYYEYQSRYRFFESTIGGTSRFVVQNESYTTIGTAAYTVDYPRGLITFGTTTAGLSRYLTGYSYDLNAAAADIWSQKASHYVTAYDFSTDNHSMKRSQIIQNCLMMAKQYGSGGRMKSVRFDRSDT